MSMRETCRIYRRTLLVQGSDESHPAACDECRRFRDIERETKVIVKQHRDTLLPPEGLRERIAARLEADRSAPPSRASRSRVRVRVLLAAAVLLSIVVGAVIWIARTDGRERADETAELIVEDHLKYARKNDRLQIASASPEEMQAWFERELQLAAKLPELRDATLVGGRRCSLGGRPAALAFYERRGASGRTEPLSLFVFEPRGEDWSGMHEVTGLAGKRACRHHDRGVGVLVWQERALVYVVAGALDSDELAALLEKE